MKKTLKDIFENNYPALCNYALTFVKDHPTAEDIVQTVFIQLWENDKITQIKEPAPYLIKCVKYKCLDYLKQPNRKQEILTNALPDIRQQENQSLKEEDILPMLHFFAAMLPPKMQQVFLMSRQQGMSYKEIAGALDISVKTVENHMGTALKKLRTLLQQYHYLPVLLLLFQ